MARRRKRPDVDLVAFKARHGADNVGILDSVGGSWSTDGHWRCSGCGGTAQLLAWRGQQLVGRECLTCQDSEQLELFGGSIYAS